MTDHKFTDDDVIKALEGLAAYDCKRCLDLGHDCLGKDCDKAIAEAALALINRQKAQIIKEQNKNSKLRNERNHLKAEIDDLKRDTIPKLQNGLEREIYNGLKADEEIEHLKVEIESLKIANEKMYAANKEQEAEIEELREINKCRTEDMPLFYAEAIKEFAERLKTRFTEKIGDRKESFFSYSVQREIDNIVKEMTEGKND